VLHYTKLESLARYKLSSLLTSLKKKCCEDNPRSSQTVPL
jgi:hypothetical protein